MAKALKASSDGGEGAVTGCREQVLGEVDVSPC